MRITILGSGSATPTLHSHPSAQVIQLGSEYYLIDCGEGTQYRLLEMRIRPGRLKGIFITHLHGDHYFGLFGLLTSLSLSQRSEALYLFGPRGLNDVLTEVFRQSDTRLSYPLHFHEIDAQHPGLIYETDAFSVSTVPLRHRIPCTGFVFREKPGLRNLLKDKISPDMTYDQLRALKEGKDVLGEQGKVLYKHQDYTLSPRAASSYAYCSDTVFRPELVSYLRNVTCLYHEATFLDEQAERAKKTFHSTASQAALLAREAQVGHLLIGHLSSRYPDACASLEEARAVFPPTTVAVEGQTYEIPFTRG
ncbi:ribonuclease Z [Salmonirosea aquatica]|uniref:Ribonuclease Z n=1 Tax=Salmonirosea aquatica TaxID=2654236 RepID=A0A7C9FRL9_9BACT|nr:ribonuclease Z [Cytophagaceae bacterium SJW1-29]